MSTETTTTIRTGWIITYRVSREHASEQAAVQATSAPEAEAMFRRAHEIARKPVPEIQGTEAWNAHSILYLS